MLILHAQLTLNNCQSLHLVQGESLVLTLVAEAVSGFPSATPTNIEVKIQDPRGNVITKSNGDITRLLEDEIIQVIRFTLTPSDTASLGDGWMLMQVAIDGWRTILRHSIKVVESI